MTPIDQGHVNAAAAHRVVTAIDEAAGVVTEVIAGEFDFLDPAAQAAAIDDLARLGHDDAVARLHAAAELAAADARAAELAALNGHSDPEATNILVLNAGKQDRRRGRGRREEGPDKGGHDGADVWPAPSDPMAVARAIADQRRAPCGTFLIRRWRGQWMTWRPGRGWSEADEAAVRTDLYRALEHVKYWKAVKKGEVELTPWAPSRRKVGDVVEALGAVTYLPAEIDSPAWIEGANGPPPGEIVTLANGLLHVTTRQLLEHNPRFFATTAVSHAYNPSAPPPTRWLAFLDDLWPDDPDAKAVLAEWAGYLLSGATRLHKILLLVGPSRAGKGVILRVFRALLGAGNVVGPTLDSLASNFGLAPLIGRPLALVSDARLGRGSAHQVVERLLSISGEDALTVDRKYKEPWTGRMPTRFVIASNELPGFGDASGAIARRFLVLTLRHSWLGRENPALTDELLDEMPGILAWALDGLDRLVRQGRFTEPQSSRDAIVALADLVSPAAAFVRERCCTEPSHGHETETGALYKAWKLWGEDNGHPAGTAQAFGRKIRAVVPGLQTGDRRVGGEGRERRYVGIALRVLGSQCTDSRVTRVEGGADTHDTRADPLSFPQRDDPIDDERYRSYLDESSER